MDRITKFIDYVRSRFYYKEPIYIPGYAYSPWKKWAVVSVILLLAFLILHANIDHSKFTIGGSGASSSNNSIQATPQQSEIQQTPSHQNNPQQTPLALTYYAVYRVIDGDTIDVTIDGNVERIRFIGVDTPETVDPRKPAQCFGIEASDHVKNLLAGNKVGLESDSSQGNTDKYNRLLRYVFLADGTNLDEELISDGYGHEYTYASPYKYQSQFKQAEQLAASKKVGLWDTKICNGNTN